MVFSLAKKNQLALLAVDSIGRKTLSKVKQKLVTLELSWSDFWLINSKQLWLECGLNQQQQLALKKFKQRFTPESYFGWLVEQGIALISNEDKRYPKLLKEIDDKPPFLYVKGNISGASKCPIAVVGTRNISGYGRLVCEHFIPSLVAAQGTIVSGFMYGVDQYAQQQTVDEAGVTIGVLGYGFKYLSKINNQRLVSEVLNNGGGFITEYPPWMGGHKGSFPERNRIVAGVSLVTLVIEAGKKSGSHITANLAAEYGRGVCAVPGPITNPYSEGTKWLVNQGARLVTSAQEVLIEAGVSNLEESTSVFVQPNFIDPLQKRIYQQLLIQPLDTDGLAKQLEVKIPDLNIALSLLELEGHLQKQADLWLVKNINSVQ